MFCNKRRLVPFKTSTEPIDGLVDLKNSNFYVPSAIDEFLFEKSKSSEGIESITITSDISMLFSQKRLDRLTTAALVEHFNSMSQNNHNFSELRKKLTDEQLCSIVKSRYIQSPSELLAYSNYLVSHYGDELASLAVSDSHASVDSSVSSDDNSSD